MFADAVNTAFKFPNLFRRIFGEGAMSSVFVPIYTQELVTSEQKAARFASEIFSLLFISLTILTLLFQIFMPYLLKVMAPGFVYDNVKYEISVLLCRITMPYMLFISMSALLGGIMNSHKRFASFAFMPVILNIAVIVFSVLEGDDKAKSIYVSTGVVVGGIFQFTFMLIAAKNAGIKCSFASLSSLSKDSYIFLKNMVPATIGSSVTQINLFVSQAIASFAPGAISILSYSDRIYQFPLSIIGICFGTVLLPNLSALYKEQKIEEALTLQTKAIKLSMLLSFACVGGIISLAHPIMHVIYERGAFTAEDTLKTAQTISIFALGLPAFITNKVITPVFYARLDTTTPLKITTITILSNIILNFLLIDKYQHLGIAIGTTISSWINVGLLVFYCRRNKIKITMENIFPFLLKGLLATLLMSIILYFLCDILKYIIYSDSSLLKFLILLFLVITGIKLYFFLCIVMKLISIKEIKQLFKK